ncbi:filamentous hemagglutinin [Mannheimia haemolytica]|nr:filamentous hemagglutinin [Mannheimia haemolytica]
MQKAYQIYTHSEREKVTEAKLELGKVETRLRNEGKTKEEIAQHPEYLQLKRDLNDKQQTFDNAYGTGSKTKRAVEAAAIVISTLSNFQFKVMTGSSHYCCNGVY